MRADNYRKYVLHLLVFLVTASLWAANPLENWHLRNRRPTDSALRGIVYGNGCFVAVGDSGTILNSSNGLDWIQVPSGTMQRLNTITFGQGCFVTGGDNGTLLWSEDGVNWNDASQPISYDVTAVCFGKGTNFPGGLFVAFASTNTLSYYYMRTIKLTSSDGMTWNINTKLADEASEAGYSNVAYGNNRFVALGSTFTFPTVRGIYSSTGTNWHHVSAAPQGPIAFGNNLFVNAWLFDRKPTGITLFAKQSIDGYAWPLQNYTGVMVKPFGVCFGAEGFVAVGERGYTAKSLDGTNWTTQITDSDAALRAITYGAGLYVAVGDDGVISISSDGIAWTQSFTGPSRDLAMVTAAKDGFVAVGSCGFLSLSSNGIDWLTIPPPTTNRLAGVLNAGAYYVVAGANGTILSGDNLSNLSSRASGTSNYFWNIAFGGGIYVAVGSSGTIVTSTNAIDWRLQSSGTTNNLLAVVFGGDQFIAIGNRGAIVTSSNGLEWTIRSSGVTWWLDDIAFGNGCFVASSYQLGVVTSHDGTNWEICSEVRPSNTGIAYGNGLFVVPGISSDLPVLWISSNGRRWEKIMVSGNVSGMEDIAYNNGTFVSVGRSGLIWQSDPILRLNVVYDGLTHLFIDGPSGCAYRIEASDTLGFSRPWAEVVTLTNTPNSWIDPQAQPNARRFYRALLLP